MQTTIYPVELEKIIPSLTNPRKYFSEVKLKELAASIKQHGVIQDVTLRDHPTVPGKYELVFGERRYRASKLAGMTIIPAKIRLLSDDEVQELQFIENLEREDVHPMDEAVTFRAMMTNKIRPWVLEDIAAKINKPVSYIVQRLQMNKLIDPLQKEFWDGKFLIGHALLFSRLTPADQNECIKNAKRGGLWGTVKDTHDYIERNIIQQLSTAPFKMEDIFEVKCGAGPCLTCLKRSGSNQLLFPDIKPIDRCFDKNCFKEKREAWLIREVKNVLIEHPEIVFAHHGFAAKGAKINPEIIRLINDSKIKILDYSQGEFRTVNTPGYSSFKALWVSGDTAGTYQVIYRKQAVKTVIAAKIDRDQPLTKRDINLEIGAIKERLAQAEQNDAEKIWNSINEKIQDPAFFTKANFSATVLLPEEATAIGYALLNAIKGNKYINAARTVLNLPSVIYEETIFKDINSARDIGTVTEKQIFKLLRLFTLSALRHGTSHMASGGPFLLLPMIKIYSRKDIEDMEMSQQDAAMARFKSSTKRIERLEEQKKLLPQKKENIKSLETKVRKLQR